MARYRVPPARGYVRWPMRIFLAACALVLFLAPHALYAQSTPASERPIAGLGHAHMDTSCSPGVSADFDRALALLHNFWYARALEAFTGVAQRDPDCAIAYWGAAKTYDHPFWDPPTRSDESTAWALVQKGMRATQKSPREGMYLAAVAALYKEGGAGPKSARRSEEHTSELQSRSDLVCRLLLEKKKSQPTPFLLLTRPAEYVTL